MSEHEAHLIYFERYLRNKLPVDDRLTFEHKLAFDSEFRSAFLHYKKNRKTYLDELFDEPDTVKKNTSLSNIIYLLITTISLAVSILYYMDNQLMRKLLKGQISIVQKNTTPNIQVSRFGIPQNEATSTEQRTFKMGQEITEENLSPSPTPEVVEEVFIADTLLQIKNVVTNDSTASMNEKTFMPVELWKSPLNYYGYHYNGAKMIIFGIESFEHISVEELNNELWLRIGEQSYLIQNTNTYVKF